MEVKPTPNNSLKHEPSLKAFKGFPIICKYSFLILWGQAKLNKMHSCQYTGFPRVRVVDESRTLIWSKSHKKCKLKHKIYKNKQKFYLAVKIKHTPSCLNELYPLSKKKTLKNCIYDCVIMKEYTRNVANPSSLKFLKRNIQKQIPRLSPTEAKILYQQHI